MMNSSVLVAVLVLIAVLVNIPVHSLMNFAMVEVAKVNGFFAIVKVSNGVFAILEVAVVNGFFAIVNFAMVYGFLTILDKVDVRWRVGASIFLNIGHIPRE